MIGESPVRIGEVLAGKYRVERVLGSGGMGVVVAAVHVDLAQRVALKFLLPQALTNAEASQRFLREARAAVRIESEHVARVIDVGRLENGAPYMVMEYLDGSDLSAHTAGEPLPIEEAVDFVLQACEAMAVAHACGIVHRDLKPANLFVTRRPDGSPLVKVLDFGISKLSVADAPANLTNTSAMMGSPLYMSPEQVQSSRRVDARADIWSLGVILYELLTGAMPFEGESLGEVLTAVVTKAPRSIRAQRPEVPAGLELAVLRALEKALDRRFANVGEFVAALIEFAPPRSRVLFDRVSGVLSRAGLSSAPPPARSAGDKTVPNPPSELPSRPPLARPSVPIAGATDANWVGGASAVRYSRKMALTLGIGAPLLLGTGVAAFLHYGSSTERSAAGSSEAPAALLLPAPSQAPAATTSSDVPTPPPVNVADAGASPAEMSLRSAALQRASARAGGSAVTHRATPASTTVAAPSAAPPGKKNPLSIQFK